MPDPITDKPKKDVLEWIKLREELGGTAEDYNVETGLDKLLRKVKANPLVPIGKHIFIYISIMKYIEKNNLNLMKHILFVNVII